MLGILRLPLKRQGLGPVEVHFGVNSGPLLGLVALGELLGDRRRLSFILRTRRAVLDFPVTEDVAHHCPGVLITVRGCSFSSRAVDPPGGAPDDQLLTCASRPTEKNDMIAVVLAVLRRGLASVLFVAARQASPI